MTLAVLEDEPIPGRYDIAHLNAFHRRIFGDIYDWAGELRSVVIAKDDSVDPLYRDLATVLWGLQALDSSEPQPVIDRMAPITRADNPWHCSAIEVTAIAHLKAGDRAAARTDYQRLTDDLTAPQGMRARAAEMVAALAA